jgi:hypothetical protein
VFDKLRDKHALRKYEEGLADWQRRQDDCVSLLEFAQSYQGESSSEIILKSGERVFAVLAGAGLVEDRRGRGHWEGRSSGVSIPIGSLSGRTIRYRVGSSRGAYVSGTAVPTLIDKGTVYITNKRIIFQGAKQTRQCLFDKLVAVERDDKAGTAIFSVSNRQKPTIIHYGNNQAEWFDFRLDLALAHYRGELQALVTQLQNEIDSLEVSKPRQPRTLAA